PHICRNILALKDLRQVDFCHSDAQIGTDISMATRSCVEKFARDVRKVRDMASVYANLAANLRAQGKYVQAEAAAFAAVRSPAAARQLHGTRPSRVRLESRLVALPHRAAGAAGAGLGRPGAGGGGAGARG